MAIPRPELSKLTETEKDALIYALLDRIDRQEERIKELERRLGLNSGNSGKPPSSDGYGKKPAPKNLREKTGKKSGGQEGHEGTNLRPVEHPEPVKDHCPDVCGECSHALSVENSTGYRKRQVFDIPKPKPVEVTEHREPLCACPRCGAVTRGAFPEDVAAPAQYGANIAALVVYLSAWHFIPEDRLAELIRDVFHLDLTTATIAAMLRRKAEAWNDLADHMGEQVKQAAVKHMDETGLRIAGVLQWLSERHDRIVAEGLAFHEAQAPLNPPALKRRGRAKRRIGHNLLIRLRDHKEDALRFLTNPDVPFTNNQAERDARMMKLRQKISGCFRAAADANNFATLRSVLSTARKQGWNILGLTH